MPEDKINPLMGDGSDGPKGYVASDRLYLDRGGKVVKEDDPNRVTLLAAVGATVPEPRARELGLYAEAAEEEGDVEEKSQAEAEDKSVKGPTKTAAKKTASKKG